MSVEVWSAIGLFATALFGYLGIRYTQNQTRKVHAEETKVTENKNAIDGYKSLVEDLRHEVGRMKTKQQETEDEQEKFQVKSEREGRERDQKVAALENKVSRMEREHAEDMGAAVGYITVLLELIQQHVPAGQIPNLPERLKNYFNRGSKP